MQKLFSTMYGSRLYGTSTPTSDIDWKHIVLPSLDSLLLGNGVKNHDKKTNNQQNVRNTQDDVDETFTPVQVFARDYYGGQTYALELAWAIEGTHAGQQLLHPLFEQFVRELRERFLTSNIKAMMGYAVNQASLYSMKGERLSCVQTTLLIFNHVFDYYRDSDLDTLTVGQIAEIPYFREKFAWLAEKYPKYFRQDTYDIGGGDMKPCFMLLEKHIPFTNKYGHTMKVLDNLAKKYGSRASDASIDNVDWKATMHALRIINQGIELLSTGSMSFPLKPAYAAELLAVKRGEIPLASVTAQIDIGLDKMKALEKKTQLQSTSVERQAELDVFIAGWMRKFYKLV
jgi:hypothetical protein